MKSDQMLNFMHLSNQANALRGLPARHWVLEAMRSSMRVRLGTPVAYPHLLPLYERKARFSEPGAGLWETSGRGTALARVSLSGGQNL
jgi:hypothetical protein